MNAAALQEILTLSQVAKSYGIELGGNESQTCPFCGGARQLRTTRNRWYKCYKCNRKGDVYQLLQDLKVTSSFKESFNILKRQAVNSPEYKAYRFRVDVLTRAFEAYRQRVVVKPDTPLGYYAGRGWTFRHGEIGYADSHHTLRNAGFSVEELTTVGLIAYGTEVYSNHLIFPIHNYEGEVVHFSARALDPTDELRWKHTSGTPPINNFLYAANNLKDSSYAVICEGISDTRSLIELGEPAVGVFGVTIPLVQHANLFRHCKCLVAFFDRDRYAKGTEKEGQYKSWSQVTPHLIDLAVELKIPVLCLMTPDWSGVKDANEYLSAIDYDLSTYQKWASKSYQHLHVLAAEIHTNDLSQHPNLWRLHAAVPNAPALEQLQNTILQQHTSWADYLLALHA
jgi:ribosomal protein L37AE/L43A